MKKLIFFKFILIISLIGAIVCSLLVALYVYDVFKKDKSSQNLADSFSVSYLYSNDASYLSSAISAKEPDTPFVIGIVKIDKLKIDYPILSEVSEEALKIAPCRFAGPLPNNPGNLCIAGHNYVDNTFFARISSLVVGDEINIYGINGELVKYRVFNKKEVESTDLSCTSQNTEGKRMLTLMTCNSIKQTRIIIQAQEKI